jgi:hypothetical protein
MKVVRRVGGSTKGRLGWTNKEFNEVDWKALEQALSRRPNSFQLWLSKQAMGCVQRRKTQLGFKTSSMTAAPAVGNEARIKSTSTGATMQDA